MAAGRAIITHDTPSIRELTRDGVDGLLVPESESKLRKAVEYLMDHPDVRSRLGASAGERLMGLVATDWMRPVIRAYRQMAD